MLSSRAVACKILEKVIMEDCAFHPHMINLHYPHLCTKDAAFAAHLCFSVMRFYHRLEVWLSELMPKPLKHQDTDIKLLLLLGLVQLFYSDTPSYAAIHATVSATKDIKKPWAKALINGVLRQAQRCQNKLLSNNALLVQTAHPTWLVKHLQEAWPQEWENIIKAHLQHPPFSLRINTAKISREIYIAQLNALEIEAIPAPFSQAGILVKHGIPVDKLPGFKEGLVSVQDSAAQLAATLLEVKNQQRVLDACAAPGGKTTHLLELNNTLELLALEKSLERCKVLKESLSRCGHHVKVLCQDASLPEAWWDGFFFDRILLDAPCSATGIIRRHPEIKLRYEPQNILLLVQQQKTLLEKLWPLLKPNGILLYATCSILPEENVSIIEQFLHAHHDAKEMPIMEKWGITQKYGRQILPGQHQMDGFYYAKLLKHS